MMGGGGLAMTMRRVTTFFGGLVQYGGVKATWSKRGATQGTSNEENDEAQEEKSFGEGGCIARETRDSTFERSCAKGTHNVFQSFVLGAFL